MSSKSASLDPPRPSPMLPPALRQGRVHVLTNNGDPAIPQRATPSSTFPLASTQPNGSFAQCSPPPPAISAYLHLGFLLSLYSWDEPRDRLYRSDSLQATQSFRESDSLTFYFHHTLPQRYIYFPHQQCMCGGFPGDRVAIPLHVAFVIADLVH